VSESADRIDRADEIFDAVLDLPEADQAAFVERACGADSELRTRVMRLLIACRRAATFFDTPALQFGAPLLEVGDLPDAPAAPAPQHIGNFRVVGILGRGGMGEVYLGERDDGQFEQRVALKVIQLRTAAIVQRFIEERRILALLEHPGIARLVDGGLTADGLPYFAMELVEGEPIDQYCETRKLSLERRLELFGAVCEAVTYAHRHLVIHRDLKPSNILVTADGRIKLLDFGIAKLLSEDAVDDTARTQIHALTPEFAAPEQLRNRPVSTATDVYALGVLLYILLAGQRPYDVRGRSLVEADHIICAIEPPKPSSRVAEPLRRRLRGDLDLIVQTALHKEPLRRYQSAADLKQDLVRFLAGLPVAARPDSAGYRTGKFVGRHRLGVTAVIAIMLLVIAWVVTVLADRRQVQRALLEAQAGTRKAEQVTDFMLGLFQAAERGQSLTDTVTARELLSRGLLQARELTAQPELQAQMLDVIGRLHMQLNDHVQARPLLEEALQIRRGLYGELHPDVLTSMANVATVAERAQDTERAIPLRRAVLAERRRLSGADDPKSMDALHALASTLHGAGDPAEAEPLFDEWLMRLTSHPREVAAWHADQLSAAASLSMYRGAPDRAEAMHREALRMRRALFGDQHHLVVASLVDLSALLGQTQRLEEAEPLQREAIDILRVTYPQDHSQLANALKQHGVVLNRLQRFADAQQPLREALAMRRRMLGPDNIGVGAVEVDLAFALIMSGDYVEGEAIARDAARIYRAALGDDNSMVFFVNAHLADALRGLGRYREAEPMLLAAWRRFDPPRPITAQWGRYTLSALVRLYEAEGRTAEAERYRGLLTAALSKD
jgi:serine/threonine-protein kinase